MVTATLREFLDNHHIDYTVISHSRSFTAQETAEAAHIPGNEFAKNVIVMIDGKMAMVVESASRRVPLGRLKALAQAADVHIADETEFRERFGDCELGAMPPFGNLYDMDVYVDEQLTRDENIVFNAGSHTELIKLAYKDFAALAHPKII
jgi:Ala-tRNA(Pro) deacylase